MRVHDQTSRRVHSRAWSGLILLAAAVAPFGSTRTARGQGAPGAEPTTPRIRDPIDLTARHVRAWDAAGVRWIHLAGRAAILQGVEGVRADEALVRVTSASAGGVTTHRLDVYAETPGRDSRTLKRTRLATEAELRLKAYEPGGLTRLGGPPAGLTILPRSGLALRTSPVTRTASYGITGSGDLPGNTGGVATAPGVASAGAPKRVGAPPPVALPPDKTSTIGPGDPSGRRPPGGASLPIELPDATTSDPGSLGWPRSPGAMR